MTPDELDRILCRKLCGDANECSSLHYAFKEDRRAALRERDARLKDVLDNLVPHGTSAGRLDLYGQHREECVGDDKNIACVCGLIQSVARFHAALAALRALLEEAGK